MPSKVPSSPTGLGYESMLSACLLLNCLTQTSGRSGHRARPYRHSCHHHRKEGTSSAGKMVSAIMTGVSSVFSIQAGTLM